MTNAARANGTACCKAENGQEITELPDGTIIGLPLDEPSEFDPLSKTHALAQGEEQAPATHGPQLAQAPRCGASAHAPPPSELFGPGIYFFKYAEGLYYNVSGGLAPLSLCTTMCPEVSPLSYNVSGGLAPLGALTRTSGRMREMLNPLSFITIAEHARLERWDL